MIKKILQTLQLIALVFVVPLLPSPSLLCNPVIILGMAFALGLNMSGPGMQLKHTFSKTNHDGFSFLVILIVGILGFVIPVIDFAYFQDPKDWSTLKTLGFFVAAAGLLFRIWSIRTLGKFFTAKVEIQRDHQVIKDGPYRVIRHPSYLGAWVMFLGVSLLFESTLGFLFNFVGFFIAYHYRTTIEEASLRKELGSPYEEYLKESWKMIPYVY